MSMTEGTVPWPGELALRYARAGWWRGRDLGAEFADVAAARPDATALVDGTTRISYRSLLARADALAARLEHGALTMLIEDGPEDTAFEDRARTAILSGRTDLIGRRPRA